MKRTLLGLLLAASAVLAAAPVPAVAGPAVSVEAVAGFEGKAKAGMWAPVTVTIKNEGADLEAMLQVEVRAAIGPEAGHAGLYQTPVSLAAGATKRMQLYVPTQMGGVPPIDLVAGGATLAHLEPALSPSDGMLVGVLGITPGDLPALSGGQPGGMRVQLIGLEAGTFPTEPAVLQNLDAVVLDRFAYAELPDAQRKALQAWVEHGGRLILGTGPEAKRLEGIAPWLPVTLGPVSMVDLPGIGRAPLAGLSLPAGDPDWQVLQEADGHLLAAAYRKGMGQVLVLSFDPALEPFASWPGLPGLLAGVLPQQANLTLIQPLVGGKGGAIAAKAQMVLLDMLNQSPIREVPSARGLLWVLAAYAVLTGPVHFLLLRGFRRTGWALLTLPLLAAAGTVGAYSYTQRSHASDMVINTLTVLEGQPGGQWLKVQGLTGFFMPPGASHRVTLGDALLTPAPAPFRGGPEEAELLRTTLDGNRTARLEAYGDWTMHALAADSYVPVKGTVAGSLTADKAMLKGQVTNQLPFALADAVLISGTTFQRLGDLKPGESAAVALMQPAFAQQFGGENPLAEALQRAVEFRGFGPQGPTADEMQLMRRQQMAWAGAQAVSWMRTTERPAAVLVGWTDYQALPVQVDGRTVQADGLAMYVQPLRVEVGSGEFALPASWSLPKQVAGNGQTPINYLGAGWSLGQGESVVMEFTVPTALADRVTQVEVKIPAMDRPADGKYPLAFQFYRWADATWQNAESGVDGAPLPPGGGFINPAGAVRVQVTQVGAQRIPLGVPGMAVRGKGVAR